MPNARAIGALTTYTQIRRSHEVAEFLPALAEAAATIGAAQIQNRGTLGGNIANASPAADLPPALLVYGAELELASRRGGRRVAYDAFHRGYKKIDLGPDELERLFSSNASRLYRLTRESDSIA